MSPLLLRHPQHQTLTVPDALMERYESHPPCRLDLFHRDCLLGLEEMVQGGVSADVVVTSPPYNIGRDYDGYDDARAEDEYFDWLYAVFRRVSRILAPGGSFFLNLAGPPSDPLKPWRIIQHCLLRELAVQNVFHWVKHWSTGDEPTTGHCTPINSGRYVNNGHEYVFHCTRKKDVTLDKLALGVPYADKSNLTRGTRGKNGDLRDRGNIWLIPENPGDQDARWLACLLDAEGSLHIERNGHRGERTPQYHATVTISNSHRGLLETAQRLIGTGTIYERGESEGVVRSTKQGYVLRLRETEAIPLLERVYPHLIVKQEQARLAMHLRTLKRSDEGSRRRLTEEEVQAREHVHGLMKAVNQGQAADLSLVPKPVVISEPSNTLLIPYETIQRRASDRPHPATFPEELVSRCLKIHGLEKIRRVVDPFMGLGTTARVCAALGKSFIGFELCETYWEQACLRTEQTLQRLRVER